MVGPQPERRQFACLIEHRLQVLRHRFPLNAKPFYPAVKRTDAYENPVTACVVR